MGFSIGKRVLGEGGFGGGGFGATGAGVVEPKIDLLPGLVSWWAMNEAAGQAVDAYGANHLTDNNTVGAAAGKVGGARDFEKGTLEFFSRPHNASLSVTGSDFTFAFWMNIESYATAYVIGKDSAASGREYGISITGLGRPQMYVFAAPAPGTVAWNADLSLGVWYFVTIWWDTANNQMGISVNDAAPILNSLGGSVADAGTAEFRIGARHYAGSENHFDGMIDEVGFWKRVLTSAERKYLYNNGAGRSYAEVAGVPAGLLNNLVSHWTMNEAAGDAVDGYGANHLTAVNAPGSAAGKVGNARSFTSAGTKSFSIASNASLQVSGDFTLVAWVNLTAAYWFHVFNKTPNYLLYYHAGSSIWFFDVGGVGVTAPGPVIGTWNLIVAWYDSANSTINLQVNNGTPASAAKPTPPVADASAFLLSNGGDGLMDEVALWKRVLTPAERTWLYNSGNGRNF